jgi:hypothetical protein
MLGEIGSGEMNDFVREIPLIELLLVFSMLGLGGFGFYSQLKRKDPPDSMKYGLIGKWILAGLVGLAFLAIILFFIGSLIFA